MITEKEKLQESNDVFFTLPYHSLLSNENSLNKELCQNKRLVHYLSFTAVAFYILNLARILPVKSHCILLNAEVVLYRDVPKHFPSY